MKCTITSTGFEEALLVHSEHERPIPGLKLILLNEIWKLYIKGVTDFYVNCERGIPLWAAEIICSLKMYNKIALHIVVPHENQAEDWTDDQHERYFQVHSKADSVEIISSQKYTGCYEDADRHMAEHCCGVLVISSGMCNDAELAKRECVREVMENGADIVSDKHFSVSCKTDEPLDLRFTRICRQNVNC
ncbi:MAG: SLOG family protein [Oscillospiraceae bacterium]